LSTFITKGFEEPKLNMFLQFISNKHKIPLEIHSKPPKLQIGYVALPLFRKNQTSARFTSISWTQTHFPLSVWHSTEKIKRLMRMKKLS